MVRGRDAMEVTNAEGGEPDMSSPEYAAEIDALYG